jgi:hypothetical protein
MVLNAIFYDDYYNRNLERSKISLVLDKIFRFVQNDRFIRFPTNIITNSKSAAKTSYQAQLTPTKHREF